MSEPGSSAAQRAPSAWHSSHEQRERDRTALAIEAGGAPPIHRGDPVPRPPAAPDDAKRRCHLSGLAREEDAFALEPPAVARERTVRSHHAVAGNGDREMIGRTGFSDSVGFFRSTDARRDLAQRLPDQALEFRAGQVERQIETARRILDEADDSAITGSNPSPLSISCASGKRSRRSRGSASESSPSKIAQMPFSLVATKTAPSEQRPAVKRITSSLLKFFPIVILEISDASFQCWRPTDAPNSAPRLDMNPEDGRSCKMHFPTGRRLKGTHEKSRRRQDPCACRRLPSG